MIRFLDNILGLVPPVVLGAIAYKNGLSVSASLGVVIVALYLATITKRPDLLLLRTRALMEKVGGFVDIWDAARRPLHNACLAAARERLQTSRDSKGDIMLQAKAEYIGMMGAYQEFPLPNVMLMATVEDQERLAERIEPMMELAARGWHTGLISEPMLGTVDPTYILIRHEDGSPSHLIDALRGEAWDDENGELSTDLDGEVPAKAIEWFVCGMEQGPGKRPRGLRFADARAADCQLVGVPFFFKKDSQGHHHPGRLPRQFPAWMLCDGEAA